ncbi:MAG: hypothetical protein DMG84_16365 [Acidobacteria bacterium]|nr:MAG: hypothetical protein DMG84_16365 [Acidobacteriota bacterium]
MKARVSLYVRALLLLLALGVAVGCSKAPNDAQLASDIQTRLSADSGLQGKQLSVQSSKGTVTLSGTVDNENQRQAAARYAASAEGVKQVVEKPRAAYVAPGAKPRVRRRVLPSDTSSSASTYTAPVTTVAPVSATTATTYTAPPPQKVTIPSGTTLAVRLVDPIDSETNQQGQTFRATLDSPLAVEGDVAIPAGYDVQGHIIELKSAGKFAGQSVVALQLDRISVNGKYYNIQTDQYRRQGSSRGKNTAAKVGTGAGIGAIIGAIAGGGKGAAIGAAAGGGLGGGVQAATKGQQIKLPSETVLNFTLQAPLTVVATAKTPDEGRPRLERPTDPNQ